MGRSLFALRRFEASFSSRIPHILKFEFEITSCLITSVWILLETFRDNSLKFWRYMLIGISYPFWLTVKDAVDDLVIVCAGERESPGSHFIEHNSDGENVCSLIQLATKCLFRTHVLS